MYTWNLDLLSKMNTYYSVKRTLKNLWILYRCTILRLQKFYDDFRRAAGAKYNAKYHIAENS